MIKAIIFDIGGTLVKTDHAIIEAARMALKENGINFSSEDEIMKTFGRGTKTLITTAVASSYFGENIQQKIEDCWQSFQLIFPIRVAKKFKVFPGVFDNLENLRNKGIILAIFTGFNRKETEFILKKVKLFSHFDLIITKDDVKEARPNPEALFLATAKLKLPINACMYVGDTVSDIQMAKNARMKMVCVQTGVQDNKTLKKEKPDFFVKDIPEIVEKLFTR